MERGATSTTPGRLEVDTFSCKEQSEKLFDVPVSNFFALQSVAIAAYITNTKHNLAWNALLVKFMELKYQKTNLT